jgi:hypothetical protein
MSVILDQGSALFAGLNVISKRSYLTEYSCRIAPTCYPELMYRWFDARRTVIPSTWIFTLSPSMATTL